MMAGRTTNTGKARAGRRQARLLSTVAALAAIMALLLAAPLVAGCGGDDGDSNGDASPSPTSTEVSITDDAGNEITLDEPATKVVSLAPSTTEDVFAMNGQDALVGVDEFSDYPAEAQDIEKVGGFSTPNIEKIVSLDPDLVLATAGVQTEAAQQLADLGIQVAVFDPLTLEGIYKNLEDIGTLLGKADSAKKVIDDMKAIAADVESKVEDLETPTVFFEIYSQPLLTAGSNTLIDDLINRANGTNIGAAAGDGYPEFNEEQLLQDNPDVYIAVMGSQSDPGEIEKRAGYDALRAVQDGRVYVIDDNLVTRAGPRAVEGLQEIAKDLHPDAF